MDLIDPVTLDLVTKALDAASLRHAVLAHNVANANVAGFRPSHVSFENQLSQVRDALARGEAPQAQDLMGVAAVLLPDAAGSTVELDGEVAAMSQNTLQYQALLKAIDREMGLMSLAVSDGKR